MPYVIGSDGVVTFTGVGVGVRIGVGVGVGAVDTDGVPTATGVVAPQAVVASTTSNPTAPQRRIS
ncbi:hypothetical protein GCM10009630_49360 [Kribbella jejuensis]